MSNREQTRNSPESAKESVDRLLDNLEATGKFTIYRQEPQPQSFMFETITPSKQWSVNGVTIFQYGTNVCVGDTRNKIHAWDHIAIVNKILSMAKNKRPDSKKNLDQSKTTTQTSAVNKFSFQKMLASICFAR